MDMEEFGSMTPRFVFLCARWDVIDAREISMIYCEIQLFTQSDSLFIEC